MRIKVRPHIRRASRDMDCPPQEIQDESGYVCPRLHLRERSKPALYDPPLNLIGYRELAGRITFVAFTESIRIYLQRYRVIPAASQKTSNVEFGKTANA